MVQVKKVETEEEFGDVAAFWAKERDRRNILLFGKTVEGMFGLNRGAKTLLEECRILLQACLEKNGEIWFLTDRNGVLRAACWFQLRPEKKVATYFEIMTDIPEVIPYAERGIRKTAYLPRLYLYNFILRDLKARGFEVLEQVNCTEIRLKKQKDAVISWSFRYFDTLTGIQIYRVAWSLSKLQMCQQRDYPKLQELLLQAEAM